MIVSKRVTPKSATTYTFGVGTKQVFTGVGVLRSIIVTTAVTTAPVNVYDGTSTSGTLLFGTLATAAIGTVYDLDIACTTGCFIDKGSSGTGDCTITYDN